MSSSTMLLIVDVQNDFCSNGALAAKGTTSLLNPLNNFIKTAEKDKFTIAYTKDWHKITHKSFNSNGGRWAVHCVAGSKGAELNPNLYVPAVHIIIHKGYEDNIEGYSAFDGTGLEVFLKKYNINDIIICGIATSFCVAQTAISSATLGFNTTIIKNLTRDITSDPKEIEKTWQMLAKYNITLL